MGGGGRKKSLESVAGQVLARERCRTGALAQAARGKPSRERGLLTMDPEAPIRSRQRASGGESRAVDASTFGAGWQQWR